jgi:N-acetylglucosamine transport system permease protein
MRISQVLGRSWGRGWRVVLVGAWCAGSISLLLWILVSSMKSTNQIFNGALTFPTHLQFDNYVQAWSTSDLASATANSVLVDGSATVLTLLIAAPAAYVLSRVRFRGANLLSGVFIIGIGIPIQALLIPLYVLMVDVGLLNSLVGLVVAYVSTTMPFIVFLLTGYFRSLPHELEEAAALDGAGAFRTFFTVMVPVAWPGILTAAIFELVALWGEFFIALTLINSNQHETLPLAIVNLYGTMRYTGNWSALFAGVVIIILPITVAYGILSKRIMSGLTLGAIK